MENLSAYIEAILFLKGESMTAKKIAGILGIKEENVLTAINELENKLQGRGLQLVKKENSFMLATSPESSEFTKKMIEDEFDSQLSKSAVETLSIVIYRGPVTRSDIDYIRGVNSSFILRNLMIKGLVERITNPRDSRSYIYKPSFQLLQYLGITKIEDMPEFGEFNKEIDEFNKENEENNDNNEISSQSEEAGDADSN
jgi:segregation and condensation protein B